MYKNKLSNQELLHRRWLDNAEKQRSLNEWAQKMEGEKKSQQREWARLKQIENDLQKDLQTFYQNMLDILNGGDSSPTGPLSPSAPAEDSAPSK